MRRRYRAGWAGLLLVGAACGGGTIGPVGLVPTVASIGVGPAAPEIPIGGTIQLVARPVDAAGNPVSAPVVWSSSDERIATVDSRGLVRAVAGGRVTISAASGTSFGGTVITVLFPEVASVAVTASGTRFLFGRTVAVTVTPRTADGSPIAGCHTPLLSSDPAVVSVLAGGLVAGVGVGTATLTAEVECGGVRASTGAAGLTMTVEPLRFLAVTPGGSNQNPFLCGLVQDGAAYCWGTTRAPQLGRASSLTPVTLPGPVDGTHAFVDIVSNALRTCGLTTAGAVLCWGEFPRSSPRPLPTPIAEGFSFRSLDLPSSFLATWTCGVTSSNVAVCWGDNRDPFFPSAGGWLGTGSTANASLPTPPAVEPPLLDVTAGKLHACGVAAGGTAYCWGVNDMGQLGNGSFGPDPNGPAFAGTSSPVPVAGGWRFAGLSAGGDGSAFEGGHTCGVTVGGQALCWGEGELGQLGNGATEKRAVPVLVEGGIVFRAVTAGGDFTCGLTPDGEAYCWGANQDGELGRGHASRFELTSAPVSGGLRFVTLRSGVDAACGITADGLAYCWGALPGGARPVPTLVPGQG